MFLYETENRILLKGIIMDILINFLNNILFSIFYIDTTPDTTGVLLESYDVIEKTILWNQLLPISTVIVWFVVICIVGYVLNIVWIFFIKDIIEKKMSKKNDVNCLED